MRMILLDTGEKYLVGSGLSWISDHAVVNRYSHSSVGGPREMTASVRGSVNSLLSVLQALGMRVLVQHSTLGLVWWGYVYEIEIRVGQNIFNLSLGDMFNSIAVTYTEGLGGALNATSENITGFGEAALSIARYGKKQKIFTTSLVGYDEAMDLRATLLTTKRLPALVTRVGTSEGGSFSAYMVCKGPFAKSDWLLYGNDVGIQGITDFGDGTQGLGSNWGQKVGQQFTTVSTDTWDAKFLKVRMKKIGSPTDNVKISLMNESSGEPNATLGYGNVAGTSLSEHFEWYTIELSSPPTLSALTNYWIVVERTGSADDQNYYDVDVSETSTASGNFRTYDGASWIARVPDAKMIFRVEGIHETTRQLSDMLATLPWVSHVEVLDLSYVYTNPYHDGRSDVGTLVRQLVYLGDNNQTPLAFKIDAEGTAWIKTQLAKTNQETFKIDNRGNWYYPNGQRMLNAVCPTGVWYQPTNVVPTGEYETMFNAGQNFAFINEYDALQDMLTPSPVPESSDFGIDIE